MLSCANESHSLCPGKTTITLPGSYHNIALQHVWGMDQQCVKQIRYWEYRILMFLNTKLYHASKTRIGFVIRCATTWFIVMADELLVYEKCMQRLTSSPMGKLAIYKSIVKININISMYNKK